MRTPVRSLALALALIATANFALSAPPAFAEDPPHGATPAAAPPAATESGTVLVHMQAGADVVLQRRAAGATGAAWETACSAPCDARAPVGDEYRVVGGGLNPSNPFFLDGSKGAVTLYVTPARKATQRIGTYALAGGGALIVTGAIVLIAAVRPSQTFTAEGTTSVANTNALFAGGVLILAGLVAGIYGGSAYVSSAHTAVSGDVAKAPPARGAVEPQTTTAQAWPVAAPAWIVPLVQGRF